MGYLMITLLQIYYWVSRWKNFENRSTFAKVTDKSIVACFFDSQCSTGTHLNVNNPMISYCDAILPSLGHQRQHWMLNKLISLHKQMSNESNWTRQWKRLSQHGFCSYNTVVVTIFRPPPTVGREEQRTQAIPNFSHICKLIYLLQLPPEEVRSIAMSVPVCLSVCPLADLKNYTADLQEIFCMCYSEPWLGPPLTTVEYDMYFRFVATSRFHIMGHMARGVWQ